MEKYTNKNLCSHFQEAYFLKFIECDQLAKGKTIKFENYLIVGIKEVKGDKTKDREKQLIS